MSLSRASVITSVLKKQESVSHIAEARSRRGRIAKQPSKHIAKQPVRLAQNTRNTRARHNFTSKDVKVAKSSRSSSSATKRTTKSVKQTKKNKKVYDEDIFGQEFDINF